jgi:hypothetical protein
LLPEAVLEVDPTMVAVAEPAVYSLVQYPMSAQVQVILFWSVLVVLGIALGVAAVVQLRL